MTKIFIKYLSLLNTFLIILSFFIYLNLKHKNTISHKNSIEYSITISVKENLTRLEINNIIKKKKDEFIHLYGKFITDNEIAKVIINVSLSKDIPINIAFALAKVESNFNIRAIRKNKTSIDYGLFQLNNKSFPNVDYFDLYVNTKIALSYLKELYMRTDSWELAIVYYNSGFRRISVPVNSLNHLRKVLIEERKFDNFFERSL